MTPQDRIKALPIWTGPVEVSPLGGGITNQNYLATDGRKKVVVRLGDDIALHMISRQNELSASRAAEKAGISPEVVHWEPGILVIRFIEGKTLAAADFQSETVLQQAVALIRRAHREMPLHLRGAAQIFWPFHVIRNYAADLVGGAHRGLLAEFLADAKMLEGAVGPVELVYGHNDLLPANFIMDDNRLWLIDWDYAGFGSPLFDLGGLAANANLSFDLEAFVLEQYFGNISADALRRYRAMKAAAALRETLWSMVSESHSTIDFDYAAYTEANLATYRNAMKNL
jgi:thiamine kinase-like enzyme